MTSAPVIRRALAGERAQVVDTVAAAFAEDPAWRFILDDQYERLAPEFAGALFDLRAPVGGVWVSDDLAAVAMWEGPDGGDRRVPAPDRVWERYRALAGRRAHERLASYHSAVAEASAPEPHWYLGVLATRPGRRREGLASALLAPVLEQADRLGMACCLETSTEANRRFYERRGFTEATDVVLAAGPPTWWLRRAPGRVGA